jgi:hypothetical protein
LEIPTKIQASKSNFLSRKIKIQFLPDITVTIHGKVYKPSDAAKYGHRLAPNKMAAQIDQ